MDRLRFNFIEMVLIGIMGALFLIASVLYVLEVPVLKMVFGWQFDVKQERVGEVASLEGRGRREALGQGEFENLTKQAALYNFDTVVTAENSTASIKLDNGGTIDLGPDTMVRLEFDSRLSLGGVSREGSVNIIAGNVSGQANGGGVSLKSRDKTIALAAGKQSMKVDQAPLKKPNVTLARAAGVIDVTGPTLYVPANIVVSPSPSPTLAQKDPFGIVQIVFPRNNDTLSVPKGSQRDELTIIFRWKISPAHRVKAVLRRLATNNGAAEPIFADEADSPEGKGQHPLIIDSPGNYEFEVRDAASGDDDGKSSKVRFTVAQQFEGIEALPPLVGGSETGSNQLSDKLLKDFNITLRWKPYQGAKSYHIRLAKAANSRSILEKDVDDPEYVFNKDKVIAGRVYWSVSSPMVSGFVATSKEQLFVFDFLPPTLMIPENNAVVSRGDPRANTNTILFTWRKTNFTETYELDLAEDAKFARTIMNKKLKENFYILKNPIPGTYFWRVKSNAKDFSSPPSQPYTFTVKESNGGQ